MKKKKILMLLNSRMDTLEVKTWGLQERVTALEGKPVVMAHWNGRGESPEQAEVETKPAPEIIKQGYRVAGRWCHMTQAQVEKFTDLINKAKDADFHPATAGSIFVGNPHNAEMIAALRSIVIDDHPLPEDGNPLLDLIG